MSAGISPAKSVSLTKTSYEDREKEALPLTVEELETDEIPLDTSEEEPGDEDRHLRERMEKELGSALDKIGVSLDLSKVESWTIVNDGNIIMIDMKDGTRNKYILDEDGNLNYSILIECAEGGEILSQSYYDGKTNVLFDEILYDPETGKVYERKTFDRETGNLLSIAVLNEENKKYYYYDSETGNLTEEREIIDGRTSIISTYDDTGELVSKTSFFYDDRGNISKVENRAQTGKLITEAYYDESGNLSYENYYDEESGRLRLRRMPIDNGEVREEYDSGKLITRTITDTANDKQIVHNYDKETSLVTFSEEYIHGILSKEIEYNDGKKYKERVYNEEGNLSYLNLYNNSNFSLISKFEYDSDGIIINKVDYTEDAELLAISNMEYSKSCPTILTEDIEKEGLDGVLNNDVTSVIEDLTEEEKDRLIYYYANIDNIYGDSKSFIDKIEMSKYLMKLDEENDNYVLYSTPQLCNGKFNTHIHKDDAKTLFANFSYEGEYLKYYNEQGFDVYVPLAIIGITDDDKIHTTPMDDEFKETYIDTINRYYFDIMKNSNVYTDKFMDITSKYLNQICIAYYDSSDNLGSGYTAYVEPPATFIGEANMVIRGDLLMKIYDFMVGSYTHELGHVFGCGYENFWGGFDGSREWKNIWEQIVNNDANNLLLRDYAKENCYEGFAECIAEYFAVSSFDAGYNPNDLLALEIDYNGYTNMYDYIESILNY